MAGIHGRPPESSGKSVLRELLETIAVAVLIAFVIKTFALEVYRVKGSSMESTLHSEERVLVNKFVYRWIRDPRPGDIVVFRYPRQPNRDFVKRIVAVAGDRIAMYAGQVYVNDQLLAEAPTVLPSDEDRPEQTVPPGAVWVLGDNRSHSEDSRFFGQVPLGNIQGQAFMRVWPLDRVCRFVNPADASNQGFGGWLPCR